MQLFFNIEFLFINFLICVFKAQDFVFNNEEYFDFNFF